MNTIKTMKNLLYKTFKLDFTFLILFFSLLSALILIPNYPSSVALLYCFIAINIIFSMSLANKDNEFTGMLPVKRDHIVLSKTILILVIEIIQFLVAIPFIIISATLIMPKGNIVGMDPNLAFFGINLIAYSVFNLIFLPLYFKTGYKNAVPFVIAFVCYFVVIFFFELLIQFVPVLKNNLDTMSTEKLPFQLICLFIGIIIFISSTFIAYKLSTKKFEKVNL